MIDIHSHILPGMDDGAKDMASSINMLKHAVQTGTRSIIATPHYFRNHFEVEYETVIAEVEKLKTEVVNQNLNINIYSGQEVFADKYTVELYKKGIVKGLCGSDYMLLEFPMDRYLKTYMDIIYELCLLGVKPVIAHPERYLYIIEDIELLNSFISEGCLFQLNSGSITGVFGKRVEKTARRLIEAGACHFLASDAHSTGLRCTGLNDAMDITNKISTYVGANVQRNAQLLLMNDKVLDDANKVFEKKNFFNIFKKN